MESTYSPETSGTLQIAIRVLIKYYKYLSNTFGFCCTFKVTIFNRRMNVVFRKIDINSLSFVATVKLKRFKTYISQIDVHAEMNIGTNIGITWVNYFQVLLPGWNHKIEILWANIGNRRCCSIGNRKRRMDFKSKQFWLNYWNDNFLQFTAHNKYNARSNCMHLYAQV